MRQRSFIYLYYFVTGDKVRCCASPESKILYELLMLIFLKSQLFLITSLCSHQDGPEAGQTVKVSA